MAVTRLLLLLLVHLVSERKERKEKRIEILALEQRRGNKENRRGLPAQRIHAII